MSGLGLVLRIYLQYTRIIDNKEEKIEYELNKY